MQPESWRRACEAKRNKNCPTYAATLISYFLQLLLRTLQLKIPRVQLRGQGDRSLRLLASVPQQRPALSFALRRHFRIARLRVTHPLLEVPDEVAQLLLLVLQRRAQLLDVRQQFDLFGLHFPPLIFERRYLFPSRSQLQLQFTDVFCRRDSIALSAVIVRRVGATDGSFRRILQQTLQMRYFARQPNIFLTQFLILRYRMRRE